MAPLRVLVVDDQRLMLAALRLVLGEASGIEVVGEARGGSEALGLIGRLRPGLVLLDQRMPEMDGLTCLRLIRERYPQVKVLMFSAESDPAQVELARRLGASGFIDKHIPPDDLPAAIRQAIESTAFYFSASPREDQRHARGLTEREREILTALSRCSSNRAIARELSLGEQTVKFHLSNIYRKLGVDNRTQALRYAFQHRLVEHPVLQAPADGKR